MIDAAKRIPVAILGATGTVGQKAVALLAAHNRFFVSEVAASEKKKGMKYKDACSWREELSLPPELENLTLCSIDDLSAPFVISALPSSIALEVEPMLAKRGHVVFSNASAHRMDPEIPLLIPEVNRKQISLLNSQKWEGKIITNPNCAAVFAALAIAPLLSLANLCHVSIVTLQAISGAGYGFDIIRNLIPFIEGEEEKISRELKKILETDFSIISHVHRVPVLHGHTVALHLHFNSKVTVEAVKEAYVKKNQIYPGLYKIYEDSYFPQPAKSILPNDQSVHVGRIKQGETEQIIGLISMGHNLVRGAAGAAIANMEAYIE